MGCVIVPESPFVIWSVLLLILLYHTALLDVYRSPVEACALLWIKTMDLARSSIEFIGLVCSLPRFSCVPNLPNTCRPTLCTLCSMILIQLLRIGSKISFWSYTNKRFTLNRLVRTSTILWSKFLLNKINEVREVYPFWLFILALSILMCIYIICLYAS